MWLNIEFESKLVFPIPCDRIFVVDPVPNWTGCVALGPNPSNLGTMSKNLVDRNLFLVMARPR
jgi:hypothetical protein